MTANAKTLTRSCLLAIAAAIAQPAWGQTASTEPHTTGFGLGFAHNEQGHTSPATTSTMPGSSLASVALLDPPAPPFPPLATSLSLPLPTPHWPVLSADLRTHTPPALAYPISSAAAPQSIPAVPAPGPATLLALAATVALRRKRR